MLHVSDHVYRAVLGLRTVRRFLPKPVDDEDIRRILEAGRWTGSGKNRQGWRFIVVRDRERLDRLADCGDFSTPILNAPLVVAPVALPGTYEWDMGRVAQNMMLAAAAIGIGSCPVTLHREQCSREVLGIPDDHRCRIVVAFGYPDEEAEREGRRSFPLRGRRPLEEMVSYETF